MNMIGRTVLVAALALGLLGCEKTKTDNNKTGTPSPVIAKADQYAIDVLGTYYLWNDEIKKDLVRLSPDTCRMPMEVVKSIRYHEGGKEVDKWTMLTDDLLSFKRSIQGQGLTYGYDLQLGKFSDRAGEYFLVVSYVCKDGPAMNAGLKRGDVIITLDGKPITKDNVYNAFNTYSVALGVTNVEGDHISGKVRTVRLKAVDMYEDPILVTETFEFGGRKVGYLVYNGFDLKSSEALPEVFKEFKSKNIDELIIDLRYNGGGYAFTENILASMIAPQTNVLAGDVFQTEVYNSILADVWKQQGEDTKSRFSTRHKLSSQDIEVDVSDANPGLSKVYAIVTGGTASASEGLIVGLMPYMDVTLVGTRTHGKYCAGILLAPKDFYTSRYDYTLIRDWGMYVMISKFADCNGNNASIPDGIPVDLEAKDNPLDGYQLGDENETMLRAALQAAGKTYPKSASVTRSYSKAIDLTPLDHGAPRGILIRTDLPPLSLKIPVIPTSLQ